MIRLQRVNERQDSGRIVPLNCQDYHDHEDLFREKYVELMEALFPIVDNSNIFTRIVIIANNLFGTQRGALFWFSNGAYKDKPELKACVKLTPEEIKSERFKFKQGLVLKAFSKRSIVAQTGKPGREKNNQAKKVCSAVAIPLMVKGKLKAVLYHDQFLSQSAFDFFSADNHLADHLIRHLGSYVEYGLNVGFSGPPPQTMPSLKNNKTILENRPILYDCSVMDRLIGEADKAAPSDTSVLIVGETGVGKELLARRIHNNSLRRENPFVTINATTIPEGLFESELFGHEKGSFTGAERRKKGLIEIADGGTLFIDEVGEMPLHMQVKLLRAIQEKTFYRVGGTQPIQSDFRLVTATNSDLMRKACEGRFREDLYYRLNLFSFTIPPLRERDNDVLLIAENYLEHYSNKYCKQGLVLNPDDRNKLKSYSWPGNVRELKNVIEKSVIMTSAGQPLDINIPNGSRAKIPNNPFSDDPTLDEINRRYIRYVLKKTNGKISGPGGAAELMNIGRTTLTARMRKLGLK